MKRVSLLLSLLSLPCLLAGCGDSNEDARAIRAASFTTSSRPAPNPTKLSLQNEIRQNVSMGSGVSSAPRYELYSDYKGEDIRQVTGVSGRKLILAFTADWCEHSLRMREALKKLAEDEKGNVQVVDVNADKYPKVAEEFSLTKVPTIFIYTEGIRLRSFEGAHDTTTLKAMLDQLLSSGN